MKVFVSGKIRGLDQDKVRSNFAKVEEQLRQMGSEVVNPITLMADLPDETKNNESRLLLYLLTELSHCEAIWMMEGWRADNAASCQYHFAKTAGMKVMNASDDILDQLLGKRYRPFGSTEEWMAKTSAEIAMELSDMCEVSSSMVSDWLHNHGFSTKVVNDTYMWIVYEFGFM